MREGPCGCGQAPGGDSKRDCMAARASLPGAHVLVVDDVPTNLAVARCMLRPYGMRVDCVPGGRQAVDAVRSGQPRYDAIFMDHMMPGMDGIAAARAIREEIGTEYARSVPIVAMTGGTPGGDEQLFLRNGFQAFLRKPLDASQLDAVITKWVRSPKAGDCACPRQGI